MGSHLNLCSVCLRRTSAGLNQTHMQCKHSLRHSHKDCACVFDGEIFLAIVFVSPVSGADIDQGGDDSLVWKLSRVSVHSHYKPEK